MFELPVAHFIKKFCGYRKPSFKQNWQEIKQELKSLVSPSILALFKGSACEILGGIRSLADFWLEVVGN